MNKSIIFKHYKLKRTLAIARNMNLIQKAKLTKPLITDLLMIKHADWLKEAYPDQTSVLALPDKGDPQE